MNRGVNETGRSILNAPWRAPRARSFGIEMSRIFLHSKRVSHLTQAREVFDIELAALKAVRGQLDAAFILAVEMIVDALRQRGKVIVVGIGTSGNVGRKNSATLTSTR